MRVEVGRAPSAEIALDSKPGVDATKKLPGEGFKRPWRLLIKVNSTVRKKTDALFGGKP